MNETSFRSLIIERSSTLHLCDGLLIISNQDSIKEIPLGQISSLIITTSSVSVTAALLAEMMKNNISVIVCDEKRLPVGVMHTVGNNYVSAGRIIRQTRWNSECQDEVWSAIVRMKIKNSISVLFFFDKEIEAKCLERHLSKLEIGDWTNREAICAKIYFQALFGRDFNRNIPSDINAALNYGYAILASHISRFLAGGGYCPALGIHHHSQNNYWNLTYDLIEPFRFIVDKFVYERVGFEFDRTIKNGLIELGEAKIKYGKRRCTVNYAMDCFCNDVLKSLDSRRSNIKEVSMLCETE